MALRLLMLGPPGAGKGTQAVQIARDHGVPKISTGDMLRDAVTSGSELGREVKETVARGQLVSDDLIVELVRRRLADDDARGGFVLDGFPRTVAQARALDGLLDHDELLRVLHRKGRLLVVYSRGGTTPISRPLPDVAAQFEARGAVATQHVDGEAHVLVVRHGR